MTSLIPRFIAALSLTALVTNADPQDGLAVNRAPTPMMNVEICAMLVDELSRLPAWTQSSPNSPEEWSAIAAFARKLQQLSEPDVRSILFAYMIRYHSDDYPTSVNTATRAMLVLRLMFAIPPDAPMSIARAEGETMSDLIRCAGRIPDSDGNDPTLSSPVSWRDGRPVVIGAPRGAVMERMVNMRPIEYQPQMEYDFFRAKFPMRSNLSELVVK